MRPSYLYNGNSYTGKTSLYWKGPLWWKYFSYIYCKNYLNLDPCVGIGLFRQPMGGGYYANFLRSVIFLIFQNRQNTC